jgi:hypothetical protein
VTGVAEQIILRPNDFIFFLHIPKTAGSALYNALVRLIGDRNVLSVSDRLLPVAFGDTYSPSQIDGIGIQIVRQHRTYDFLRFFPRPAYVITMLRSPLSRIISYYRYVKSVPAHPLHKIVVDGQLDLEEFLDIAPPFDTYNSQTWRLCGSEIFLDESIPDSDKLMIAKQHLETVAFFGLQEEFSTSLKMLSWKFNWPNLQWDIVNRSTVSFPNEDLLPSTKEKIESLNLMDKALFDFAKELFVKRKNEYSMEQA